MQDRSEQNGSTGRKKQHSLEGKKVKRNTCFDFILQSLKRPQKKKSKNPADQPMRKQTVFQYF